ARWRGRRGGPERRRRRFHLFRIGIAAACKQTIGKEISVGQTDVVHAKPKVLRIGFRECGLSAFAQDSRCPARGGEGQHTFARSQILVSLPSCSVENECTDESVTSDVWWHGRRWLISETPHDFGLRRNCSRSG